VVRLALAFCLLAGSLCPAAEQQDFSNENLQAIERALRKQDASLDSFQVLAKKPVDAMNSVMLVEAAPTELRPGASKRSPVGQREQIGLYVVSGNANQIRLVLDTYPLASVVSRPVLDQPNGHAAYLHFYSDYGFYHGSIKYVYDLADRKPQKIRYGILALTSVTREGGRLRYRASFGASGEVGAGWKERYSIITIQSGTGDSLPAYQIVDTPRQEISPPALTPIPLPNGQSILIARTSETDRLAHVAGIDLVSPTGQKQFVRLPVPTHARYLHARPKQPAPVEIENDIGPFAVAGTKLWFANTFYDGEGVSGVGAIGSFDATTHAFDMRYLPEIELWSGSALLLDGKDLWVGLMRRPEGANYGGGLLRYDTVTGAVRKYPVQDLIYTIDRLGDTLYCGTSHGLYTVRGDKVTQLRFEPDGDGKLGMVAREVR
jgi:hypothetical protein